MSDTAVPTLKVYLALLAGLLETILIGITACFILAALHMLAFKLMLTQMEIYQPGGVTGFKLGSSLHKFILSFDCHKGNKISVRTKDTFRRSRLSLHCTCCLELSEQLHCR